MVLMYEYQDKTSQFIVDKMFKECTRRNVLTPFPSSLPSSCVYLPPSRIYLELSQQILGSRHVGGAGDGSHPGLHPREVRVRVENILHFHKKGGR